jgi:hypothetical protein
LDAIRHYVQRLLPRLDRAPPGVRWRFAHPKPAGPMRAELARSSGSIETSRGAHRYEAGKHYIVHYGVGDRAPMRRAFFERTYTRRADGRYEPRLSALIRYFTLPYPVLVETLDGAELAHPGDWIIEADARDLCALPARDAREMYEPA